MELTLYQIDAFANRPFEGNPAAVCPLQEWLPDETLQSIAAENNLSETAFFVPTEDGHAHTADKSQPPVDSKEPGLDAGPSQRLP
jgi:PhzF family phenazine biosynthesis protein